VLANVFYWITAALLLGVVIVAHELGHFWSARLSGIKVQSFGIGFGPKLLSRKGKDGTMYTLRLLPIGGYCRFYGEDETVENDADSFYRQPVWKRAFSTISGPVMNMLTAVLAFMVLYAALGIPVVLPAIDRVEPGTPAEAAGLLPGDKFVEANGVEVTSYTQVQELIAQSGGEPITFTVERGGSRETLIISPRLADPAARRYQIGVWFATGTHRFGVLESARLSLLMTKETVRAMYDFLRNLIVHRQGAGDVVGPIGTVRVVREQTEYGGMRAYLSMMAMISVNLGFFNMLPIPGLDGSRLLFLAIEAVRRKRIDPNKEGMVHLIGVALLLLLMLPIYVRDVMNLF